MTFFFSFLFIVPRTLNMRSVLLTNFEVHNTVLLTLGTMSYSRALELTHLAELKLYTHQMAFGAKV